MSVSLPTDRDARKYYRVSKQRLEEAKTILGKLQFAAASQYLGGYAVECVLKALVITVTPLRERPEAGQATIEWLKGFGHDLHGLRVECSRRGINVSAEMAREFVFVSTWDPQSRYEPGPGNAARAERFLVAAETIVKWADERM